MSTTLTQPYAHVWESFSKGSDDQGPFVKTRYYFDDWTTSDQTWQELIGKPQYDGKTISRLVPHQHPLYPKLYCREAVIEGVGSPILNAAGYPLYSGGYFVDATYRPPNWGAFDNANLYQQIDPGTPLLWCTQELDFGREIYTVPTSSYTFVSDGKTAGVPVKRTAGIVTMRLIWHQIPYMPMGMMKAASNKTNSTTFLGCDVGTVLFLGARVRREFSQDGSVTQQVEATYQQREYAWNMVPRKDKLAWDTLTDSVSGRMFGSYELNNTLFL